MKSYLPKWLTTIALAAIPLAARAQESTHSSITIADVRQAWQQRQDRVKQAKFAWREDNFWPTQPPHNTRDLKWTREFLLAVDGNKMRVESQGETPVEPGRLEWLEQIDVFDGQEGKSLYPPTKARVYPQGAIGMRRNSQVGMNSVRPLAMSIRPFDSSTLPLELNGFRVVATAAMLNPEESCVLLEKVGKRRQELWLSPQEDFSIRRLASFGPNDVLSFQFDISHQYDSAEDVWVPSGWKIATNYVGDGIHRTISATVTSYSLNQFLPASYFQLELPEGTILTDQRNGGAFLEIQRANGTRREILNEELKAGLSYERLLETEPGEAIAENNLRHGRWWWLIATIGAAAVLFCVTAFIRLKRRRSVHA